jgi:hypothetical protein
LRHPVKLGSAKLQVLGQLIQREPFVVYHDHFSEGDGFSGINRLIAASKD